MSEKINNGGPAYPVYTGNAKHWEFGMTLRDAFAIAALPGLIRECRGDTREGDISYPEYVARCAYLTADAMIKEREKKA